MKSISSTVKNSVKMVISTLDKTAKRINKLKLGLK